MKHSKEYNKFLNKVRSGKILTIDNNSYQSRIDMEIMNINTYIEIIDKYSFDIKISDGERSNNITYDKKHPYEIQLDNETLNYIIYFIKRQFFVYPTYISFIDGLKERKEKYNDKYLDIKYKNIKITFTCKYDDGLYSNDIEIPDVLYYISRENEYKMLEKRYLSPLNFEKKYFFHNLDDYENILENMKRNDIKTEYNLYEVKIPKSCIIHKEPSFKYGFYLLSIIRFDDIKLLKENI